MVATEDGDALRVADLEGDQKRDGLYGKVTSVDVITCEGRRQVSDETCTQLVAVTAATLSEAAERTHEEVVCVGVWATNFEQLHQVVELAVNVSTDGDGAFLVEASCQLLPTPSRRGGGGGGGGGDNLGDSLKDIQKCVQCKERRG